VIPTKKKPAKKGGKKNVSSISDTERLNELEVRSHADHEENMGERVTYLPCRE
jgi:hypothetical protein